MTMLQSVVRRRRAVAAAGAVSAGLLVLSACDKPTPRATVTVGQSSVSTEAECYDDGKDLGREEAAKCAREKASETIDVPQSETLRIGVDPEVAETGWALWINGEQVTNVYKKTYYSFQGVDLFADQQGQAAPKELNISIVEQDKTDTTASKVYKGVWNFKLKNADD
ncbi:hypothetical protein OG252_28225 [Streptomyces sp. NBC_01352]|uniref:DUF2771 domain-containing protein n=1 Tax=Streptomyces plumbiresistens TaxID=511811 RepID=A0ABP7QEK2_9ACTN|nr:MULTISPECIES: hypothetical protein [unclassified Streptomyces]MCX4699877.1 hypothetical protein [Streptomyces sp. NBC_01373]MDQ1046550.1 hypothetical protein [Streptomyces sp. V4I2]